MKGKFVSIEGPDGCGKSTHARLLVRWLRSKGFGVVLTDEPTNGVFGRLVKKVLRGELKLPVTVEALLFAADRIQHVRDLILPSVNAGKIVVSERYVYSSIAYQSARGLPVRWIKRINRYAPRPDLAILIDVPIEVSSARIGSRRLDEFERDPGLQERVRRNYLRMARREGLKVVNGARPRAEVQAEIRDIVRRHII
ncbi:MAG: dTMP kinase [Hadesarchaea archaeon]|nr:MAG: dTMP kinase [Hadesarchaea archaeon]HDI12531.1 dTMP kinase [Hadesarchaea archaeon]